MNTHSGAATLKVSLESLASVHEEWEALADRLDASPFQTAGWTSAWWSAFGRGKLSVLTVRRGGELAALLPVAERAGALISPTNWHTAVNGPLAADRDAETAIYREMVAIGVRRIDISALPSSHASLLADVLREEGYQAEARVIQRSPFLPIEGDWDSYWSGRSRRLRASIRRSRERLAELGEVTVAVNNGEEGFDELLAEGFEIESRGWKGQEGTAITSRPETLKFYSELARYARGRGILCLAFLRVDGRAVAFHFSLESRGHHYGLKMGHDPELDHASPAKVLTASMVERAFRLGLRTYEFLGAADPYKLRWTKLCHERVRVQAFAPTLAGWADRMLQVWGRSLVRQLLRRPEQHLSAPAGCHVPPTATEST